MMTTSLGLMGDLCTEAEWIWRRMLQVQVSLQNCRHSGLGARLRSEARLHGRRCRQIRASLEQVSDSSAQQLQRSLLQELLERSLQQSLSVQLS